MELAVLTPAAAQLIGTVILPLGPGGRMPFSKTPAISGQPAGAA